MLDPFHLIHLEADPDPGGEDDSGDGDAGGDPGDQLPAPPQEGEPDPKDKVIADTRKESAKYRTQLRQAQKRVEELEGASKTELERAQEKAKSAEEKLSEATERERMTRARLIASSLGVDEDAQADAALLLDWGKIEDPEEDTQIEDAMRDLVKEKPYLLGRTREGADAGAGRTRAGGQVEDMNRLIRAGAGRQ